MADTVIEEWKGVRGYETRYEVSNMGRVRSLVFRNRMTPIPIPRIKIMKQSLDGDGYPKVSLLARITRHVHRLTIEAFLPNPHGKRTVNHKNGIKTDNRLDNLEWMTHSENSLHAFDIGLKHCYTTKLSPETAITIHKRLMANERPCDIGRAMGISARYIYDIKRGQSWRRLKP